MSNLDNLIKKATDGTLTDDNWQYILDVCDYISKDPEKLSKEALKLLHQRLATRDANILFRSLSLVVAIAENCGSRLQQEIASTEFLHENFLKKFSDKKVHKQVKIRIAEVLLHLNSAFKNDPSLKPIQDACKILTSKYSQYCKPAPSKPAKTKISYADKEQEDKELERALQLSVQEYEREQAVRAAPDITDAAERATSQSSKPLPSEPPTMTIANIKKVCAIYDLISYEPDELSFKKGDVITVIESVYRDWWRGALPSGKVGIFPLNYVTPLLSKTPEEVAREAAVEDRLQREELVKIDELLAQLASDPSSVDEDRITDLYNEVLPIKSSLAKAIEKYGIRRDELGSLHERMNEAVSYYNSLIDLVITHRNEARHLNLLPYPSETGFPEASLRLQPTSSGFGNHDN